MVFFIGVGKNTPKTYIEPQKTLIIKETHNFKTYEITVIFYDYHKSRIHHVLNNHSKNYIGTVIFKTECLMFSS